MPTLSRACEQCQTPLPEDAVFCHMCGTATPTSIDRQTGTPTAIPLPPTGDRRTLDQRLQAALGAHQEVVRLVGRGGFAEVYAVRDNRLKRELAVKVLRPELVLSDVLLERFRREAEAVAALRHPGIVPIYDVGEGEGLAYIIMPLIKGETLRARLDRISQATIDETEMVLLEAASALSVAHEEGMVHRDIKPENIMLEGKSSRLLLMDFGIAKAVDAGSGDLTQSGVIVGTPQYMSPEQASGERGIDHRADQYALAVVGYRMLTGKLPFEGETTRVVLYRQLVEAPTPAHEVNPEIPRELSDVLMRAMAKERDDRFPSIDEFAAAVIRFRASHTPLPVATPTGMRMAAMAGAAPSLNTGEVSAGSTPPAAGAKTVPSGTRRPPTRGRRLGVAGLALAGVSLFVWASLQLGGSVGAPGIPDSLGALAADSTAQADSGLQIGGIAIPSQSTPLQVSAAPTREGRRTAEATPRSDPPPPTNRGDSRPAAPAVRGCVQLFTDLDWAGALERCQTEAADGRSEAQRTLGTMFALGHGTAVDYAQAALWWGRAADAGDAEAMYRVAELFDNGRGVARSRERATILYRQAGESGHLQAQLLLGQRYERGDGVRKDETESTAWYRRAAEQGNVRAQGIMAVNYQRGRGVEKDHTEAVRWLRMAANVGDAEAQFQLGVAYEKGEGVGKSEAEAIKWWEMAAAQGHREARSELRKRGR